jgi:hypothetical protein
VKSTSTSRTRTPRTPRAGDKIDGWTLASYLGSGGNAIVWRAVDDQVEVALKMLRDPRRSESLKRFRREVELQTRLTGTEGVMPIISSSLPDAASGSQSAWAAMPIATPLKRYLGSDPTAKDIVTCIVKVAETLEILHVQEISHRDIKPENLFLLDGNFVIGDFGLADGPDLEAITDVGKPVGSKFYIAPELIIDPTSTDGLPSDVYALGKTLWVLLAGQNAPLPGQMRFEEEALRVSSYRPDENLRGIDALIDAMTANAIEDRPTIAKVIRSLRAYLDPASLSTEVPRLSEIAEDLGAIVEPRRRRAEEAQLREDMIGSVRLRLAEIQNSFIGSLKEEGVPVHSTCGDFVARHATEIRGFGHEVAGGVGATFGNEAERPATLSIPNGFYLVSGLGLVDMGHRLLRICAGHIFAHRGNYYGPTQVNSFALWFEYEEAIIGTDAVVSAVNRLDTELRSRLPEYLAALVVKLNQYEL